jgi:hypothetical protein
MSSKDVEKLASIKTFTQLIVYLRDEMGWPIARDSFEEVDDLFFDYSADELGIDPKTAVKIEEIKRLRPLSPQQPWGIFFVKFAPKRLPVVALRRILGQVALKKRASANKAERTAWSPDDLLFVSNYGSGEERQISFAHFSASPNGEDLPTLKVLGWDDRDTALHLGSVAKELTEHLAWPGNETDVDAWRNQWRSAFAVGHRETITTSKQLAKALASLARRIRDRIRSALLLETPKGRLTQLMNAFQQGLVHDLDADSFADMYAQTIAYGLLSARISDPHRKTTDDFAAHMRTNPFLREMMETFLAAGGRRGKAGGPGIDFDELGVSEVVALLDDANMEAVVEDFGDRNPQEDPVIHFYELFLKEYDARKRIQRGVFYTPQPVVSFIVRSVDELLRTEFGCPDGLADTTSWRELAKRNKAIKIPAGVAPDQDFIQILDPAAGTGTFLVEVIAVIHATLVSKWKSDGHGERKRAELWNAYVAKHLLTRLYGYELLMAPYAIAHLKIGLKLYETGYRFVDDQRANIFLTDSLEPARRFDDRLAFAVPALAHEAAAVNRVKSETVFTVIIGNPPYLREKERGPGERTERIGGWVRFATDRTPLFEDFARTLAETNAGVHAKLMYELSMMFWRLVLWLAFERNAGHGVVAMISPRAYIAGPGHAGMRKWLRSQATDVWIADLGGDNRGARKSENIFEIETGVTIGVCARRPVGGHADCTVRYREAVGTASEKLAALSQVDVARGDQWAECDSAADLFLPATHGSYSAWPLLTDVFPWQHSGSQFKRLWPIAEHSDVLKRRWERLSHMERAKRAAAFVETRDRVVTAPSGNATAKKFTGIVSLPRNAPVPPIVRYCYRAFDRQWCFLDERLGDYLRPALYRALSDKQVFAVTLMSKQLGMGPAVTVTECLPDMDVFCNRGAKDVIPLWRDRSATEPNITRGLLSRVSGEIGVQVTPEMLFCYVVALLASPSYTEWFVDDLAIPGPRLPITKSRELFERGVDLGGKCVWLHTFGERWLLPGRRPRGFREPEARVTKAIPESPDGYPEEFSYDGATRILEVGAGRIANVRPEVFEYNQSGFKPVESWLRYRMKQRAGRAGRQSTRSELDEIRPVCWSFTGELLSLLAAVEGCVALWPGLTEWLASVLAGETLDESCLPKPSELEQNEPGGAGDQQHLTFE